MPPVQENTEFEHQWFLTHFNDVVFILGVTFCQTICNYAFCKKVIIWNVNGLQIDNSKS